jgi:hypothetical protein
MMARRARELDPFFAHTFTLSATMAYQAGDYPRTLEFARQAVEASDIHLVFATVDPRWDELRDDSRFRLLLGRSQHFGLDSPRRVGH